MKSVVSPYYRSNSRAIISCLVSCLMMLGQLAPLVPAATRTRVVKAEKPSKIETPHASLLPAPVPRPAPAPFAPAITATKVDSYPSSPGPAQPGETITYTVNITNKGTTDATGVTFNDTIDANTTLVPGSVQNATHRCS